VSNSDVNIRLDHFMKLSGMVSTGGQAKVVIQNEEVRVNGLLETRRRKKLKDGDQVTFAGETVVVKIAELAG